MALTSKGGVLFNADGTVYEGPVGAITTALDADVEDFLDSTTEAQMRTALGIGGATTLAAVATADGSDPATTQALANALKVAHNALLVQLKAANIIPSA